MGSTLKRISFVCYPDSCDINEALLYFKDNISQYAYILHDRDVKEDTGEIKKPHYHVYIEFLQVQNVSTILKKFNTSVYESVRNKNGVIQYMTHRRYPKKAQYECEEIQAFNIDVEMICNNIQLTDNNELETLTLILAYCKSTSPTIREVIEYCINQGFYFTLKSNFGIIKSYLKD